MVPRSHNLCKSLKAPTQDSSSVFSLLGRTDLPGIEITIDWLAGQPILNIKIILLTYSFTYYLLCQDPKLYSIISASFCRVFKDRKETLKTELFSSSVPNKNFAILEYNLYKDEKYRFHSHIAKVFCTLWKHLSFHNMHFTCNISIVFLIFRTIYIRKQYNYIFLIWIIFWRPIQKVSNVNSEKSTPSITSV